MGIVLIIFGLIIGYACYSGSKNSNGKTNSGGYRMGKNGCYYPYGSAWHYRRRR